jgi:hypothetical protein
LSFAPLIADAEKKRPMTDFRIEGLEIPALPWAWAADKSNGIASMATSAIATSLQERARTTPGKHPRDEDDDAHQPEASTSNDGHSNSTGSNKKAKSDSTVELARKIYEEAASAVKGLNLTVEEHSSDHEDNNLDQEITDQLLPNSAKENAAPCETDPADPPSTSTPAVTGESHNSDAAAIADSKISEIPHIVSAPPESQTTVPPPPEAPKVRDRVKPASKPSTSDAIENCRFRLYFSPPSSEPTNDPNKPVSGSAAGKRKLSVSGPSVMAPATQPEASTSSPAKSLPVKNSSKIPKQETSAQPPEGVPKDSPKPEDSADVPAPLSDIVEIPKPEEADSTTKDVKPGKI